MGPKFAKGTLVRFYPGRGVNYDNAIRWTADRKRNGYLARVTGIPMSCAYGKDNPYGYSVQRDLDGDGTYNDCHWSCCESELELDWSADAPLSTL